MKVFNIILPILLLIIGLFTSTYVFLGLVILYLIILYVTKRQVLYRLSSKYFLFFLAILILIYPLLGENKDIILPLGIGYDLSYLEMSIRMCLRAILLFGFSNILLLSISANFLLSKLKLTKSDQIIEIALNNYENIAQKTFEHLKSFQYKNYKINKTIDYLAKFMADILSVNFSSKDVTFLKKDNL
jgi:hypothetical protein